MGHRDSTPDQAARRRRASWGGRSWDHPDHRAVGGSLLDTVRDAGNPWILPEAGEPWEGVAFVAFSGSAHDSHAVDVTKSFEVGVASLACHAVYLDNSFELIE